MSHYLLSLHSSRDPSHAPSMSQDEREAFMGRINALEADMRAHDAFVFTGGLQGPDASTVVRSDGDDVVATDGPFAETKEYLAGFYVVEAEDVDGAIGWAAKVVAAIGAPIEVRPFFDTRGVQSDHG